MKILFVADNFPPEKNAQASRVYERAVYWCKWGHAVTVITCFPNFPEGKLYDGYKNRLRDVSTQDGVRVVRVISFMSANAGRFLRILDFLSFMLSAAVFGALEAKPDLVVATSPQFFAAVCGYLLSKIHRVPFVMELSDLWPDSIVAVGAMKQSIALRCIENLELFLYRRAKRIVALTNAFKRNLTRRGVPATKIDVVENGVDLSRYRVRPRDTGFACELGIGNDSFVVGYIGTLGMAHGLENVLDAASRITDSRVKFLLAGPGAERNRLIVRAAELRVRNVIFPEPQTKERITALWSVCDIALVHLKNTPLFKTVIPSKMFEAMAMGLPILLACPKGEASDIIERHQCGIAVEPGDPQALARSILWLLNDPSERNALAARSLKAAPNHSRERQASDMLSSLVRAAGIAEHSAPFHTTPKQ